MKRFLKTIATLAMGMVLCLILAPAMLVKTSTASADTKAATPRAAATQMSATYGATNPLREGTYTLELYPQDTATTTLFYVMASEKSKYTFTVGEGATITHQGSMAIMMNKINNPTNTYSRDLNASGKWIIGITGTTTTVSFTFAKEAACAHTMTKVEAVAATHTTAGVKQHYLCTTCNKTFANESGSMSMTNIASAATGHVDAIKHEAVAVTCFTDGNVEYYVCPTCQKTFDGKGATANELTEDQIVIKAKGSHTMVEVAAVEATHTTAGSIAHWNCTACGENYEEESATTLIEDITTPALGHVGAVHHAAVQATHTTSGSWEYYFCETCNKNYVGTEADAEEILENEIEIIPMGHVKEESHAEVPATCTTPGMKAYVDCKTCGKLFESRAADAKEVTLDELVIPTNGTHTTVEVAAVAATHITNGSVAHWACSACNETFEDENATTPIEDIATPALGHVGAVHHATVQATHTTNGSWEYYFCETCNKNYDSTKADAEELTEEMILLTAMGHVKEESHAEIPATCSATGMKAYVDCKTCGKLFESRAADAKEVTLDELVIPMNDSHATVAVAAVAATCTAEGSIAHWSCNDCGKKFADQAATTPVETVTTAALGHVNATHYEAVAATHTTAGKVEHYVCPTCRGCFDGTAADANTLTSVTIAALGHVDAVRHEAVAATCTTAGNVEYYACATCAKNYVSAAADAEEIADVTLTSGHTLVHVDGFAATETTDGMTEHWYCSACNGYFTDENGENATTQEDLRIPATTPELPPEESEEAPSESKKKKKGCGSFVSGVSVLAIVAVMGVAYAAKRKED